MLDIQYKSSWFGLGPDRYYVGYRNSAGFGPIDGPYGTYEEAEAALNRIDRPFSGAPNSIIYEEQNVQSHSNAIVQDASSCSVRKYEVQAEEPSDYDGIVEVEEREYDLFLTIFTSGEDCLCARVLSDVVDSKLGEGTWALGSMTHNFACLQRTLDF